MTTFGTQAPKLRTAKDAPVPAEEALRSLKDGNRRFLEGRTTRVQAFSGREDWRDMVQAGQSPFAAVLGCADSRCPVEILFDAKPGDIFVCRNAGNTCTHAEGSMVGSLEFCVGALRTQLIVVMGHTQCGALKGATKVWQEKSHFGPKTALDALLQGLIEVADSAARDLGPGATQEDVASHAVKVNVMHTVEFLLQFSKPIRDAVRAGTVQVQGAVYHIETGEVEFMGPSPYQQHLLQSEEPMPPVLLQRAAAPAAQPVPQTTCVAQAATTASPATVPMTYATYAAPSVRATVPYVSQPIVHAAPFYAVQSQAVQRTATYTAHVMPSYTTAGTSSAIFVPGAGAQYVTMGSTAPVYRQA